MKNSEEKMVDASTMTDSLRMVIQITPEYLSNYMGGTLEIPFECKFGENCTSTFNIENEFSSGENVYEVIDPKTKCNFDEVITDENQKTGTQQMVGEECSMGIKPKIEYDSEEQLEATAMYRCPECSFTFQDTKLLQDHMQEHKQRPHVCDICGMSLKRKEHLDRHKLCHNKDRPYQCNLCFKAFKRNEHLVRHMVIHSGNKSHVCTLCGKGFYRKDHLKKHLQSHSDSINGKNNVSNTNNLESIEGIGNNEEIMNDFSMMISSHVAAVLRT